MTKKNPVIREVCNSTAGWNQHQRNGEEQCAGCQQAKTTYTRNWRYRTGRVKTRLVPIKQKETVQ
jgi:hypothetical protein